MTALTITLTGSAQSLGAGLTPQTDVPCRSIHLQPDGANANGISIGTATVSLTDYGVRLPASSGGVASPPYIFEFSGEGPLKLSHFYVFGQSGEKLHVLAIPF